MMNNWGMIRLITLLCFALVLIECQHVNETLNEKSISFDLNTAKRMDLSAFTDSIFIIPLETNDSILIKRGKTLSLVNGCFYINDNQEKIWAFNQNGKFVYTTEKQQGEGPGQYASCIDFEVLETGDLFIFDALRYKLRQYDERLKHIADYPLGKETLPVSGFVRISSDTILLESGSSLKFYSVAEACVLKKIEVPNYREGFAVITQFPLKKIGEDWYYSPKSPEKTLYKVNVSEMTLEPHFTFDFGEVGFHVDDLGDGWSRSTYQKYIMNHPEKAFVSDKFMLHNGKACFVAYHNQLYFAYYNESENQAEVYYNEVYKEGKFYYLCEPGMVDYVIDKELISSQNLATIENLKEDDNPVIIVYQLKK